jgi:hypothetical protein
MPEKRDNSGVLSRNSRKERPSQPDFTGTIRVSGKDYWLSAWKKENDRGAFLSLAVQPRDSTPAAERAKPATKDKEIDFV